MEILIPSLAKDWSVSEDGLTYTYKLRDAKWKGFRRKRRGRDS